MTMKRVMSSVEDIPQGEPYMLNKQNETLLCHACIRKLFDTDAITYAWRNELGAGYRWTCSTSGCDNGRSYMDPVPAPYYNAYHDMLTVRAT